MPSSFFDAAHNKEVNILFAFPVGFYDHHGNEISIGILKECSYKAETT